MIVKYSRTFGIYLVLVSSNHQVYDLMNLMDLFEEPSAKHKYLFNGDFVDRGQWGVETLMILLSKTRAT